MKKALVSRLGWHAQGRKAGAKRKPCEQQSLADFRSASKCVVYAMRLPSCGKNRAAARTDGGRPLEDADEDARTCETTRTSSRLMLGSPSAEMVVNRETENGNHECVSAGAYRRPSGFILTFARTREKTQGVAAASCRMKASEERISVDEGPKTLLAFALESMVSATNLGEQAWSLLHGLVT